MDERHRNALAVAGRREQQLGFIVRGFVAAQHRITLEQRLLARPHVVVVHRRGCRQGRVAVAQDLGIDFRIRRNEHRIGGFIARDEERGGAGR